MSGAQVLDERATADVLTIPAAPDGGQRFVALESPRRRRDGRRVENADFAAFVRRIVRRAGRRVADGDLEDLSELLEVAKLVDDAIDEAVQGLRAQGWSWARIGAAAGVSRQRATVRWGR